MTGIEHYPTFLFAGILLNLTPGADTIYILSRSIAQGRKAGVASVLGIMTGSIVHTTFAALGLSVILATSAVIYQTVKYIGAAYLVYLGVRMFFASEFLLNPDSCRKQEPLLDIYRQGVLTNVLNPKVALFFLSFLPQFIDPAFARGPLPFLVLGLTFTTTGTIWCFVLATSASALTVRLRNNSVIARALQKICGVVFVALGLQLAVRK